MTQIMWNGWPCTMKTRCILWLTYISVQKRIIVFSTIFQILREKLLKVKSRKICSTVSTRQIVLATRSTWPCMETGILLIRNNSRLFIDPVSLSRKQGQIRDVSLTMCAIKRNLMLCFNGRKVTWEMLKLNCSLIMMSSHLRSMVKRNSKKGRK